jgi:hypothetical protein
MTWNRSLEVDIHKHREGGGGAGCTELELVDNWPEMVVKRSQQVEEVESHMRDNLELVGEVAEREVGMDMDIVCTFLVSA